MSYFVYILQDPVTERFYVGQTADLSARLDRHNTGRNLSTKHASWELVYNEQYETRSEACRRERELKAWKSHARLAELVRVSR